jgi:hypothetical protein
MRRPFSRSQRGRRETNRVALLCILLMTTPFIGCHKEQSEPEDETMKATPAHGVPISEETPPTQAPAVGDPAPATPAIRFDKLHHDFGEMEAGEEVEHTFTFRNVGGALLTVEKVRTSCGCTAALISDKEIPPGGTGIGLAPLPELGIDRTGRSTSAPKNQHLVPRRERPSTRKDTL